MIRLDPVSYLSNVSGKDVAQLFSGQKEVFSALLGMIIYLQMRPNTPSLSCSLFRFFLSIRFYSTSLSHFTSEFAACFWRGFCNGIPTRERIGALLLRNY